MSNQFAPLSSLIVLSTSSLFSGFLSCSFVKSWLEVISCALTGKFAATLGSMESVSTLTPAASSCSRRVSSGREIILTDSVVFVVVGVVVRYWEDGEEGNSHRSYIVRAGRFAHIHEVYIVHAFCRVFYGNTCQK